MPAVTSVRIAPRPRAPPRSATAVRVAALGLLARRAFAGACYRQFQRPGAGRSGGVHVERAGQRARRRCYVRNTNGSVEVKPATDGNVQRDRRGALDGAAIPSATSRSQAVPGRGTARPSARCGTAGRAARHTITRAGAASRTGCSGTCTDASVTFTVFVPTGVQVDVVHGQRLDRRGGHGARDGSLGQWNHQGRHVGRARWTPRR